MTSIHRTLGRIYLLYIKRTISTPFYNDLNYMVTENQEYESWYQMYQVLHQKHFNWMQNIQKIHFSCATYTNAVIINRIYERHGNTGSIPEFHNQIYRINYLDKFWNTNFAIIVFYQSKYGTYKENAMILSSLIVMEFMNMIYKIINVF